MRTFVVLALLGVVAASVGLVRPSSAAAPVPKHLMKEPETDKVKLQGQWKVESMQMGGKDVLGALGVKFDMVMEFRDNTLTATATIAGTVQKSTATLTYSGAKQLGATNLRTVDGNGQPTNAGQKDEAFGYTFDGDKLLLATSTAGQTGAVDPLKPGPNDVVLVLTRVKK